nr:hypothetical protein [Pseudomonas fluorescens]
MPLWRPSKYMENKMLSQEQLTAALKAFGEAVPAGTKLHSLKVTPSVGFADNEANPVFVFVLADSDKDVQRLSQVIDRGIKAFEAEPGLSASLLRDKPQSPANAENIVSQASTHIVLKDSQ